jgi:hypothetical protein
MIFSDDCLSGEFTKMVVFFQVFYYFYYFFSLYLIIYILGITTGHLPTEKITRYRKRPKKTSTNSIIAREVFNRQHRKELEIPLFIDCYNHHMNSVDVANQLRATATVHFSRNKKEFFPGMFWAIDIILTNYWKIYESLYGPFISPIEKRQSAAYRTFLKALVELLFLCNSENYAENVSGTSFKEYPKYSYISHKTGQKSISKNPFSL